MSSRNLEPHHVPLESPEFRNNGGPLLPAVDGRDDNEPTIPRLNVRAYV